MKKENVKTGNILEQSTQESSKAIGVIGSKYECEQCHKTYSCRQALYTHKLSVHHGVKHIENKHKVVLCS